MPVEDGDLAEARAEMVQTRRDLGLPVDRITDEQVYRQAMRRVVASAPERLDANELHSELSDTLTRLDELDDIEPALSWQEKQAARAATAPHIVALLAELDRRGALVGTEPTAPRPGSARREWAAGRVAALGHLPDIEARHPHVPLAVYHWLEEQAVATLRSAGDDAPSRSAVQKLCARWSWTGSEVGRIYGQAFPPPPPSIEELARRRPEYELITAIAARARQLREDADDDRADQLVSSAMDFLRLWLDDDTDSVIVALRHSAERYLR